MPPSAVVPFSSMTSYDHGPGDSTRSRPHPSEATALGSNPSHQPSNPTNLRGQQDPQGPQTPQDPPPSPASLSSLDPSSYLSLILASIPLPLTVLPSAAGILLASQTLFPNGPVITIANTPISALSPNILLIGTSALTLPLPIPTYSIKDPAVFTIATQLFTILTPTPTSKGGAGGVEIAVDGTTLTKGGPIATIAGVKVSLGSSELVVGSKTVEFGVGSTTPVSGAETTGVDLGGVIWSAMGGGLVGSAGVGGKSNGSVIVEFTGMAGRIGGEGWRWWWVGWWVALVTFKG